VSKRRGHGEGLIRKRDDGRWEARIDLGWRNGKRVRKSVYGRTRREVADKLHVLQDTKARGLPVVNERLKTGEFLDWWATECLPGTIRASTLASYRSVLRHRIIPALGHVPLAKLGPQHVQTMIAELRATGLSPRSVQYTRAILRRALGQAERWDMVPRNVAALVDAPTVRRPEVLPFTPAEAAGLLGKVREDRLFALYSVAVAVGLRRGEALGLHWREVDFEAGTLRVRFSLQRLEGRLQLLDPKTTRSARTIPLPRVCLAALQGHKQRQEQERIEAGDLWQETGLVFTSRLGTPLEPRNLNRHFYAACRRAGLGPRRFHDLRHTCASLLLAQGVHPRVVMETLGHAGIQITMDTYTHVLPSLQREAADSMDSALGGILRA